MRAERVGCEIKRNGPLPEARRGFRDFRHLPGLGVPSGSFARDLGGNRIDFGSNARCGFAARKRDAVAESAALENYPLLSGARLDWWTAFRVNSAGQLGNFALPFRMGDFYRATNLGRAGFTTAFTLATVLVERILDAAFLVFIASVILVKLPTAPLWLARGANLVAIAAALSDGGRCDSSAGGGFPTENCFSK